MTPVTCNVCSRENAAGALECAACGAALALRCGRCGSAAAREANFCQQCGLDLRQTTAAAYTPKHVAERILTTRSAVEGERKHVTVLFVDVKNSVDLARRVGPEEWHRLLNRFFALLSEAVHRFEGTVNQYTGDGIMALFGAPIAHEDHAHRACRAALEMREQLRPFCAEVRKKQRLRFAVRTGLNSGEVVVGRIGDDLRMDYTAIGDTVGLASRMEQAAPAGAIYVSGDTAALVSGYFDLEDQGSRRVKGADRVVHIYTLDGERRWRSRLEVGRARGFRAFLGREQELSLLRQALEGARGGHAQVVGVAGVAGVGKSRLCQEFVEACRADGVAAAEVHCPAHAQGLPYFATLELLRALFGITLEDERAEARQRVHQRLRRHGRAFREDLPQVLDLLALAPRRTATPMDPAEHSTWLSAFVQRLVQSESARQPLVLLVDDAHWLDGDSDEILTRLVEAVGWTRTLLVVNFRREYRPRWAGVSYVQQIDLEPLPAATADELLADLLTGNDEASARLRALVRDRADGIPFFLEEILQALRQQGILSWETNAAERSRYRLRPGREVAGEISIPATVQSLLAARIDRLAEGEKMVLQTAAVIGKRFTSALLQQTLEILAGLMQDGAAATAVEDALALLEAADFVHRSEAGEYGFRHSLTQEVAYQAQLRDHRCRAHEAVARALETVYADRLGQQAPLIAHHWNAADKRGEAGLWRYRAALNVTNIQVARGRVRKT